MGEMTVKYAMVTRGGYWMNLYPTLKEAQEALAEQSPGSIYHLEKWTYTLEQDGTHSGPVKVRIDREDKKG